MTALTHRGRRAKSGAARQRALAAIEAFCLTAPSALLLSLRLPAALLAAIESAGLKAVAVVPRKST